MKRWFVLLCTLIFLLTTAVTFTVFAASETYTIPELNITLEIPSEYYVTTRDTAESETSPSSSANLMGDSNLYLYAESDNKGCTVSLISNGDAAISSLSVFSDSMLLSIAESTAEELENQGLSALNSTIFKNSQATFIKNSFSQPADLTYALTYMTYIDGIDILLVFTAKEDITQLELEADIIVDSIRFGDTGNAGTGTETPQETLAPTYTVPRLDISSDFDYDTYKQAKEWESKAAATAALIPVLLITALLSLIPGFVAKGRGRNFWGYFLLSLVISPLIVTIIVLCLKKIEEFEPEESAWTCPVCGTDNDGIYTKCKNCGHQKKPAAPSQAEAESRRTPPTIPESGTWTCASCGTENKTDYSQCKKCGKFKGQS